MKKGTIFRAIIYNFFPFLPGSFVSYLLKINVRSMKFHVEHKFPHSPLVSFHK